MSTADTRTALADAVTGVTGEHCSTYFAQSTKPLTGFVRLDRTARDGSGFGFIDTWHVVVVLPTDVAQAERELDRIQDDVVDALGAVPDAVVTTVTPSEFATPSGAKVPAVVFECARGRE